MNETTVIRAVIYCRISQDRNGAGLGVERQEKDCRALAAARGWDVITVFVDDDISAYSGKKRPAYRRMLAVMEAGQAQAVICWHTDRLHRSPRELEEYIEVSEKHKITTAAVQSGDLDLSTPSGRAVARTLGAWARFESEHKANRVRAAARQSADTGKWTGGTRPFGWQIIDGSPVLDGIEAAEVRKATTSVLAGLSLGSIVRDLNDRGILTTTGKPWSYATLRQMLRRPRNCGLTTWHGEILGQSVFEAIVTEDAWRSVCALLEDPSRRRSQSTRARWLLAGIAFCECGERVKSGSAGSRNGQKYPIYRCKKTGAGHVAKRAEPIDEYVSGVIVGVLSRPDTLARMSAVAPDDMAVMQSSAIELRARLNEVADSFGDGRITLAQMERITARVSRDLAEVELRMVATRDDSILSEFVGADAAASWKAATIEQRRAVVDALATVTLLRTPQGASRQFHGDLIKIEPKT